MVADGAAYLVVAQPPLVDLGASLRVSRVIRLTSPDEQASPCLGPRNATSKFLFSLGSLWIAGSYSQNAFNEAFQERFAPFSHVMNELKKAQIEGEFFLRDPSVRSQPRT